MTYSMRINGLDDHILVDGNNPGYTKLSEGTITTNQRDSTTHTSWYFCTNPLDNVTHENALLCLKLPSDGTQISVIQEFGNNEHNRIYAKGVRTISYCVIVPLSILTPSNDQYGLRIYNNSNQLIFDTGYEIMNVKANTVENMRSSGGVYSARVVTPYTGNWYVIGDCGPVALVRAGGGFSGLFMFIVLYKSGSSVYADTVAVEQGPVPPGFLPMNVPFVSVTELEIV